MAFADLKGKRFGKLIVKDLAPRTKNRSVRWFCDCDCGRSKIFTAKQLLDGYAENCGCVPKDKDIIGKKFGRLTVLKKDNILRKNRTTWECLCDCGNTCCVLYYNLINGCTKSCGCLAKEIRSRGQRTHNLSKTRIFRIYLAMKDRCYRASHIHYKNYGGRGIQICDEWLGQDGFINFYNWAMSNGYKDSLSIDRINNNENYSPDNCKWSTALEQQNNTRLNHIIEFKGERLTLSQASRKYKIDVSTLYNRLKKWSIEKSLTEPININMRRSMKSGN